MCNAQSAAIGVGLAAAAATVMTGGAAAPALLATEGMVDASGAIVGAGALGAAGSGAVAATSAGFMGTGIAGSTLASYGMMGMSVASSLAQVSAQRDVASNQAAVNQRQYVNAISTMDANYNNVNLEQTQANTNAQQQMFQNNRQAAIATGQAVNTTGSMGVSGGSVNDLLGSIAGQRDTYDNSVTQNNLSQQQVFNDQRLNVGSNADSTINSLTTPVMPSYALAGMQIADSSYKYTHPNLGT